MRRMDLHRYLDLPDAVPVKDICKRFNLYTSPGMIAQWRRWYALGRVQRASTRQPNAACCAELVRIDKRMTLQALRPDDWFLIWQSLPGAAAARSRHAAALEPA